MNFKLTKKQKEKLKEALYFLKKEELSLILSKASQETMGCKQDLIDRVEGLFSTVPQKEKQTAASSRLKSNTQNSHLISPKTYTNGQKSRQIFLKLIGPHFKFTTYGMDWIKKQWALGKEPSYRDFAEYWQKEFQRRQDGGDFKSKLTNRRVVFFREHKGLGLSKAELEQAWKTKREEMRDLVWVLLKI